MMTNFLCQDATLENNTKTRKYPCIIINISLTEAIALLLLLKSET